MPRKEKTRLRVKKVGRTIADSKITTTFAPAIERDSNDKI
jgi:hypothetical protein